MGKADKADAQASATTMVEVTTSNRVIRNRCTPGSNTSCPHGSHSSPKSRPMAAAAAAAIPAVTTAETAASAVQPLGQLGETISPTAVPERSASPAETTSSGRRSVALAPAAHVSAVRRGGSFPRRVQGNYARTSAAALSVGGTIFSSLCRVVARVV